MTEGGSGKAKEMLSGHFHTPEDLAEEQRKAIADAALLGEGQHDEGNAQCVNLRYNSRFSFSEALGWMQHNGTHWTHNEAESSVERAIVETLTARIDAALKSGAAAQYANLIKNCIPAAGRVQGAKFLLKSLVSKSEKLFDVNPDLLNCKNGVVDLRTGEIYPHSPSQLFTHCTAVEYKPHADPTPWLSWLTNEIGGGSAAASWLKMAVGYTLTGHTKEEILFYLFGPSRSGKGTFTETMLELLGKPLATEVNFSTFTAQRDGDSQNFDLAPLKGCRMVAASESKQYERFNEAKIKAMTGGNEIYCAFKHRDHFGYRPQFKIWLSSNHPVNADPDDDAVWGRVRVINFPNSHLGSEDKSLKERMKSKEVLEGILAWAVQGAMEWYKLGSQGLPELETSRTTKDDQRSSLDNVGGWLAECCDMTPGNFLSNSILYLSYERWCKENGIEPKKQKGFSQSLIRKGYEEKRTTTADRKTVRGFLGMSLL